MSGAPGDNQAVVDFTQMPEYNAFLAAVAVLETVPGGMDQLTQSQRAVIELILRNRALEQAAELEAAVREAEASLTAAEDALAAAAAADPQPP